MLDSQTLGKGLRSLVECIKVPGESITRSLRHFDAEASVQSGGGFPGFASFMPASSAFRKSERKKRIMKQKFCGNWVSFVFLKRVSGISIVPRMFCYGLTWKHVWVGVQPGIKCFFLNLLKRNFLRTWSLNIFVDACLNICFS